jgi:hypothetical protein
MEFVSRNCTGIDLEDKMFHIGEQYHLWDFIDSFNCHQLEILVIFQVTNKLARFQLVRSELHSKLATVPCEITK